MKNKFGKGCLVVIAAFAIFLVVILLAALFFGDDTEKTITKSDPSELIKKINKNSKIEEIDNNAVITLPDEGMADGELFINIKFPKLAAEVLKEVKEKNYEKVIILATGTFLDDKGNKSEGIIESVMFEKSIIDDINFDNWVNQVTADSTNFYKLSAAYYIHPSVFLKSENPIPTLGSKVLTDSFWNQNGHD